MAHASRTVVVDVKPEQFFSVIADYGRYPEFIPEVKGIALGPRTGNAVEVSYELDIRVKRIHYTLRHVEDAAAGRITWAMVKSDVLKANQGAWTLVEENGRTRATYEVELKLPLVLMAFEKVAAESGLPTLLDQFKARAERLFPKAAAP